MADAAPSDPRLCVCLILDEDWAWTSPHALRYLHLGLIDAAIETIVVMPGGRRPPPAVVGAAPPLDWPLGSWLTASLRRRRLVEQICARLAAIKSIGAVVAHGFGPRALSVAAELVSGRSGGIVLTLDTGEPHAPGRLHGRHDQPILLLAPSEPIRRKLAAQHTRQRIETAPLGVPVAERPAAFDHPGGDNPQETIATIIFAGRLTHQARVDRLLRAHKRLLLTQPRTMLVIAGKGPAEPALRHLAESLGTAANVIFVGRIEPVRTALQTADVFCVPHWDGRWNEALLEAMAAGLAIVAPEGGPCDAVRHGETAMVFNESDELRLAEQLEVLVQDRVLARRLAGQAQAAVRSELSVGRMVQRHIEIYRELAARDRTLKLDAGR